MGIRRLEKLINCVSNVKTALQLMIAEVPNVEKISLVLGPSPLRPLHIYELSFSHGRAVSGDFCRSKIAETLSRKVMVDSGIIICILSDKSEVFDYCYCCYFDIVLGNSHNDIEGSWIGFICW